MSTPVTGLGLGMFFWGIGPGAGMALVIPGFGTLIDGAIVTTGGVTTLTGASGEFLGRILSMMGQGLSNAGGSDKKEGESETGNWNKGSFDSVEDSLGYHYGQHGDEVRATSRDQYLRKAEEFAKTSKRNLQKVM